VDFFFNFKGNLTGEAIKGTSAIDGLTAALRAEEKALRDIGATINKSPLDKLASSQSKAKISAIKNELTDLKDAAKAAATGGTPGFFATLEKSRGPVGGLVKDAKALGEAFAGNKWAMAAVGIVAVTGAVIALGKAMLSAASDAALYVLRIADAGRNTRLLNQAADIAGGTHSQLGGIIKQVAEGPTTVAKSRIGEMARELRILRLDSRQTQLAVSAMATAESALGQGASGAIKGIAEQSKEARRFVLGARDMYGEYTALKGTGLGKRDVFAQLAKGLGVSLREAEDRFRRGGVTIRQGLEAIEAATKAKFGGVVEQQMLSLDNQFGRLKEDIGGLFAGVNITPFLTGLKKITGIFSDATAGGRATRVTITAALDELAAKAAKVFPYVESFLYGFGAGALQVYNESIKPLIDGLSTDIEGGGIEGSFNAGEAAAKSLAKTLAGVLETMISIGSAASKVGTFLSTFNPVVQKGSGAARLEGIKNYLAGGSQGPDASKAVDAGKLLAAGIAQGIRLGSPEAEAAMKFLSDRTMGAFTQANQIKSPSKRYEKQAVHIPEGAARGVERGTPMVQRAIDDMGAPSGTMTTAKSGGSFTATLVIEHRYPEGETRREVRSLLFEARDAGPRPF
jgi:hypothetical protein